MRCLDPTACLPDLPCCVVVLVTVSGSVPVPGQGLLLTQVAGSCCVAVAIPTTDDGAAGVQDMLTSVILLDGHPGQDRGGCEPGCHTWAAVLLLLSGSQPGWVTTSYG